MSKFRLLIDGDMVEGDLAMDVLNPATEEVVARCPRASKAQLDRAVAAAKAAFPAWSAQSVQERRGKIAAMAEIIAANADELADLLTSEQGKPLPDAKREVMGMAAFFRALSAFDLPVKVLEQSENRRVEAHRLPLGVVGAIIPWNFPLLTIGFKVPPALLAGNTVIVKPSPTTPLSTLRFAELVASILPRGVLNVIADANDLGEAMTGHPDVRKISFTGSTETGRKVMASASSTLKRMTLELGGNDAAIVLDDVDPKKIAPAIFRSAFFNSGQVCLAIKRLYVHEAVHEEMCAALVAEAKEWPVDNGLKQGAKIGPVQNRKQYERVKEFLREARERGRILLGGNALDPPGYFIEPTIVTDVERRIQVGRRGAVRANPSDHEVFGCRGCGRQGERNEFRLGRVRLVVEHRTGDANRQAAGRRHGVDKQARRTRAGHSVRRSEAIRHRRGVRRGRPARVHATQDRQRPRLVSVATADVVLRRTADRAARARNMNGSNTDYNEFSFLK
jgi:acyl-CoA reductase-like NAD-dependent aldehyde dehydrogenase